MIRFSPIFLMLPLLLVLCISGCGGSGAGVQVEVIPPQTVEYLGLGAFLLGNEIVPVTPQVTGGSPSHWTVSPPFPSGVLLDPETGIISGIPEQVHSPTPHTIVAQNGSGAIVVTVMISVLPTTPCQLSYGSGNHLFVVGELIDSLTPTYGCGPVQMWTISPELPSGLFFDGLTGVISGIPENLNPASVHMISGFNQFGSTTTTIQLQIVEPAPCNLEYAVNSVILSHGEELDPLLPANDCGQPQLYGIEPPLPTGLMLDPSTGQIAGIASVTHPLTAHLVTASNLAGESTFTLHFEVLVEAPCELLYPQSEIVINVGEEVPTDFLPQSSCGTVALYSVSPDLPQGIDLNPNSGLISGSTDLSQPLTLYLVRAENPSGFSEFEIQLEVIPEAPCNLSYVAGGWVLEVGIPMIPEVPQYGCGAPSVFEIFPALPEGLQFDTATGMISGVALGLQDSISYTVFASNIAGNAVTQISIEILPQPPCDFSYPENLFQLTVGFPLSAVIPQIGCGGADNFNALPPLPAGLYLDSAMGTISGIPQYIGGPTQHVILAGNSSGMVSFPISIEILEEAPCDLTYPQVEIDGIVGEEIGPLMPLVGCGQSSSWTVSPPFPDGLLLDGLTGQISGVVSESYPLTQHLIVAANSAGTTVFDMPVLIQEPAPCNLDYGVSQIELLPGESLGPLLPTVECGPVEEFSIDPALPAGFFLNQQSGELFGSSLENHSMVTYVVTAANGTGSATFVLELSVEGLAPCDLSYPDSPIAVPAGVFLEPQIPMSGCGLVDLWSIEPLLPDGLFLDSLTGAISGTALEEGESTHLITAENDFGLVQIEVNLVIRSIYHFRGSDLVIPYAVVDGTGSGTVTLSAEESILNPTYPTPLTGLSMAIQYEEGVIEFVGASQSEVIQNLNAGSGPDFWAVNPIQGGVLVGLLVSFSLGENLTFPTETGIVDIEFATVADTFVGDSTGLSGNLEWGNPTTIPLDNLVVIDGETSSLPVMEELPFLIQPQ